jgi:hypothetical protein
LSFHLQNPGHTFSAISDFSRAAVSRRLSFWN